VIAAALRAMAGVSRMLQDSGRILDVGCGFGFPTVTMAQAFPDATIVGVDYQRASVDEARRLAGDEGVADRVIFEVAAATDPPGSGYALVTFFDSLHDFGEPIAALRAAREALTPAGHGEVSAAPRQL
jgi:cyclopropane fatty-acyl-phospholipid synthase-like methyltransferase